MKNENENVELIDEEEVITLYDEEGKPVPFYEVAVVEYEDEFYVLLEPAEPMDGIGEDEVIIFKLIDQEGSEEQIFQPVDNEEILNAVFEEYLRTASEDGGGCGCGCDSCGSDCGHDE